MRVAMVLQNEPYPQDVRVRSEARTLVEAGHAVTVFAPIAAGQSRDRARGWRGGSPLPHPGGGRWRGRLRCRVRRGACAATSARARRPGARGRRDPSAQPTGHAVPACDGGARSRTELGLRHARPLSGAHRPAHRIARPRADRPGRAEGIAPERLGRDRHERVAARDRAPGGPAERGPGHGRAQRAAAGDAGAAPRGPSGAARGAQARLPRGARASGRRARPARPDAPPIARHGASRPCWATGRRVPRSRPTWRPRPSWPAG